MEFLDLPPVSRMAGSVHLPGSKSISNRTLLLAALCPGATEISGLLDADDVERMLEALRALGVRIHRHGDSRNFRVHGVSGAFPVKDVALSLGNAGTAFRPLTAVLALGDGAYRVSGIARMHQRPIGDLVDALRQLGADIRYLGKEGYPPLTIGPCAARGPTRVGIGGEVSSQFLSALLMALPLTGAAVEVDVIGELVSKPYVEITLNLMQRFGVEVERTDWRQFRVAAGASYASPGSMAVEGDASAASYFLAAGAIGGGPVRVEGVGRQSIQGDILFTKTLAAMGADITAGDDWFEAAGNRRLRGIDADFNAIPDAAMTAALTAVFADGPTTLRNIGNWRVKETDRIAAMATELAKLGARVDSGSDWMRVTPPPVLKAATIDTYDDHRIAMCFSLATLGGVPIRINDPQCVRKTFPGYFAEFRRLAA